MHQFSGKLITISSLAISLAFLPGCDYAQRANSAPPPALGADRDAHGCIPSAGYTWCARENSCVRPWELAKEKNIPNTESSVREYCEAKMAPK